VLPNMIIKLRLDASGKFSPGAFRAGGDTPSGSPPSPLLPFLRWTHDASGPRDPESGRATGERDRNRLQHAKRIEDHERVREEDDADEQEGEGLRPERLEAPPRTHVAADQCEGE